MNELLNLTDEELCLLSQKGSVEATEILMYRYKNAVSAAARRFFLSGAADEDLIQEGMIGLYRAIASFKMGVPFAAFAKVCIRNAIIDAVKSATGSGNKALNNYLPIDEQTELTDKNCPEQLALDTEEKTRLKNFFDKNLNAQELNIMELYLAGDSYKTIAKKLDINVKRVDNAISRVKQKIKRGYSV